MSKMTMTMNMETTQCLPNKGDILLIGCPEHKRSIYFKKAADDMGQLVRCIGWKDIRQYPLPPASFIKLDPPSDMGSKVEDLPAFIQWYHTELEYLKTLKDVRYVNTPDAVRVTLDKALCKRRLKEKGIAITDMIEEKVLDYDTFFSAIIKGNVRNVFIKPRYGSGAAGIIAYRYHPVTGQEIIYTSMRAGADAVLYNTKRMYKICDKAVIRDMLNKLLRQPVIVEKWIQKAQHNGVSFDLRVVYQYGKVDFMVARGSKSPITNLHLNNGAISIDELGLRHSQLQTIETLCHDTVRCFEGLNTAGIDILMTPSGNFKVIEVNGQGDLMYQDIFNHNLIYRRQIAEGMERYAGDTRTCTWKAKDSAGSGYE